MSDWRNELAEAMALLTKRKSTPGATALLERAVTELRSLERDVETVIGDESLADDIEAYLANAGPPQDH